MTKDIQRTGIARAIYSSAPVLLLDESTEARVLNNIRQMENKTVLIVTHRPAALKTCTKHLQIENHTLFENSLN